MYILDFKIGHIAKKSAIFAEHWAHVRQSFQIQKITGALKINILVWKFAIPSFYFKNKENLEYSFV